MDEKAVMNDPVAWFKEFHIVRSVKLKVNDEIIEHKNVSVFTDDSCVYILFKDGLMKIYRWQTLLELVPGDNFILFTAQMILKQHMQAWPERFKDDESNKGIG